MIVIEDGSGVAGANSYVSLEEVKNFAALRGLSLPDTDDGIKPFIILAFDYIESFRLKFQGQKTSLVQDAQWPRSGVVIDGYYWPDDTIPNQLKFAQCQAVAESYETDLMPNSGLGVRREKVSVLEVEYQTMDGLAPTPKFLKVEAFLEVLLKSGGGWRPPVIRG